MVSVPPKAEVPASDSAAAAPSRLARSCTVHVPCSTSNLGAGFDCVGLAVDRWITVRAALHDDADGPRVRRSGSLAVLDCAATDDLIWRGFAAACAFRRVDAPRGVTFDANSDIPVARGLGSSAAALVAGVSVANQLAELRLTPQEVVDAAAGVEGHPDNAAPSVLGGAVLCVPVGGRAFHITQLDVHPTLRFVFAIPDFEFRTSIARSVLPTTLPFGTAVDAASRSAALVVGLARADEDLLRAGLHDVLHVPFREGHVRGFGDVCAAAIGAGAFGATLSGSGSSIVAITTEHNATRVSEAMRDTWVTLGVSVDTITSIAGTAGLRVELGDSGATCAESIS